MLFWGEQPPERPFSGTPGPSFLSWKKVVSIVLRKSQEEERRESRRAAR